jgi:signal transduction histidine kinase
VIPVGKLFRTTAFRLSLAYLVIFTLFASFILGYVALSAGALLREQNATTIDAEIKGLAEQYATGGLRRVVGVIENRIRQPGAALYLMTTPAGEKIVANIDNVAPDVLANPGEYEIPYDVIGDNETIRKTALVRSLVLPGGFRLLVGRDFSDVERLRHVIWQAFGWSLLLVVALGVGGGFVVTKRVLSRIDQMTATTRSIMAGDLSGRLSLTGSNDEFDRLATNLNAMLDRIGDLMEGIRQVSNNIAHDLRTPLTRLRNKAEEALRTGQSLDASRDALIDVIAEADDLIKIFNALLMIARAEAGQLREGMARLDAASIVSEWVELYEPLADDAGVTLETHLSGPLPVFGSRELIGQAVANLLDNALKYARGTERIQVSAQCEGDHIVIAVADHGPGIPTADHARVTERFVRLEQSRSAPGSGLGLSLVAAIARLHHGELQFSDNRPGLIASLILPMAKDDV